MYATETAFWSQRRQAADKLKDKPTLDQAVLAADEPSRAGLSSEQYQLLAQLPRATDFSLGVTENVSIATLGAEPSARLKPQDLQKAAAQAKDSPTWLSTLVLPFGSIRDIYLSPQPGAPLVIHIQDAHEIEEAQKNMAAMIQGLRQERGINLVGLEGAQGAFAVDSFRGYADPEILKGMADYFLKEGYIGGAEYAGLTSPEPPILWGMEDTALYESNIQAFKDSIKYKPVVHTFLSEMKTAVAALKEEVYSPDLKEFDKHFNAYKGHGESLGAYVRYLLSVSDDGRRGYTNLHLLINALDWEDSLDFKRVEKERLELVEMLAKRLSDEQLTYLVQQSLLYRMGRMGYGDYYRFLRNLCRQNDIPLDNFTQLSTYITYVLLAEQINRNELLVELSRLEEAAQNGLAGTSNQRRLAAVNRHLMVLEKLTSHNMTMSDWLYYFDKKVDILGVVAETRSLASAAGLTVTVNVPDNFVNVIQPYEQFCQYATQRNNAIVENMLSKMKQEKVPTSILVAGGFHSDGLTQILRQKGVSYVVVMPKITEVPKESHYLDVFAHDPLPLEKMFSGDTIYLAARRLMQSDPTVIDDRLRSFQGLAALLPGILEVARKAQESGVGVEELEQVLQAAGEKVGRRFKTVGALSAHIHKKTRAGFFNLASVSITNDKGNERRVTAFICSKEKMEAAKPYLEKAGITVAHQAEIEIDGQKYVFALSSTAPGFAPLRAFVDIFKKLSVSVVAAVGEKEDEVKKAAL
ncbi:MAG TPA: hypothetical protein P5079_06865, partial [Elusimicrobiota bacterium]|nr:hypothetical protein [Elusimicrobiota bacterium]